MTNQEIIEKCACGLSEDIDGEFYQLYDANKICELKDEQYKIKINELINFIKGHCFESVFRNTLVIEGFDNVDDFINKIEKIK